jgi:hypothetical protein
MPHRALHPLLPLLLLLGCARVNGSVELVDLISDEALDLCEEFSENERTVACGGPPITFPASDDQLCAERLLALPPTCTATAEDFRDCQRAKRGADACEPPTDPLPECEWETSDSCFRPFDTTSTPTPVPEEG